MMAFEKIRSIFWGLLSSLYFFLNTFLWCSLFYPLRLAKFITPKKLHGLWNRLSVHIAENWIATNNFYIKYILRVKIALDMPNTLSRVRSYLVVSNHRSWVDILALQSVFNRQIPFLRFFIKDSLKWVPLLGPVWKALDYPFMKRYSKDEIQKMPWLKGRDLEAAKVACKKLLGKPSSVLIFLEGTRFSVEKSQILKSRFLNLLPPKAGGAMAVLDVLGKQVHSLVDVTIVYPEGVKTIWSLFSGKLSKIVIKVREIEIPPNFLQANLIENAELRKDFENWLLPIWADKDALISQISSEPLVHA